MPSQPNQDETLDAAEVGRFAKLAAEWWDPRGKFRPLHEIGPARLSFIRAEFIRHFRLDPRDFRPFEGLRLLDVGCGGGLTCEPLARLGARVTGIDPGPETVAAARAHAAGQGLDIDYRAARVEDLAADGKAFDAVTCLEVVEHVPDVGAFLAQCGALVRPGGLMVLSTINRTPASYALAIVAAEYVLGWLPRGTHQWERFVTPDELARHLMAAGLERPRTEGIVYEPWRGEWRLGADIGVNYMAAAGKPDGNPARPANV